MLNWLKRRARVTFQTRYTNILRRSNSPEMFLTEQSMVNQQHNQAEALKLLVYNTEGEQYALSVPLEMTIDSIKQMAVCHFFNPLEAVGGAPSTSSPDGCLKNSGSNINYRLVLVRDYRPLLEENSVAAEELVDNDEILLLECRKPNSKQPLIGQSQYVCRLEDPVPTKELIQRETANIPLRNLNKRSDNTTSNLDFKIALRQILITMIEASIHLIAPEDDAADIFVLVFEHLEKRHKPRVDKNSLKQLTDMGFTEARSIKALQYKRNVWEAMEWLLDETNKSQEAQDFEDDILLIPPEKRKSFFMSGKDPAKKIVQEFNKYVEKWFVPDSRALSSLTSEGYGEDLAKEALRITCNNESLAKEFLEAKLNIGESFQKGFNRDSPIMSAILDSPIVQVALSKPKTLFALMVLCETPNNVNVWLSDPETHPVVSQVLRIYYLEKHRLNESATFTNKQVAENEDEEEEELELEVHSTKPNNSSSSTSSSSSSSAASLAQKSFVPSTLKQTNSEQTISTPKEETEMMDCVVQDEEFKIESEYMEFRDDKDDRSSI